MFYYRSLFASLTSAFLLCSGPILADIPEHLDYNFSTGHHGWVADFSDYPVGEESFYELSWGWDTLPNATDEFTSGLYISGNNHSDDLFMFVKSKIENLMPDTDYELVFHVTIANNVPAGLFGVGGAPGESVAVKVGASTEEPKKIEVNGFYKMNVDKGEQMEGGRNVVLVGDLANESVDPSDPQYALKEFDNEYFPLKAKTDASGNLWLFFGTDSGFEATSKYYITKISVSISTL